MSHEATLLPASGEPPQWFTACACGFTSDPHDTPGAALTAYARHLTTKD
jgi:hypothetical protein